MLDIDIENYNARFFGTSKVVRLDDILKLLPKSKLVTKDKEALNDLKFTDIKILADAGKTDITYLYNILFCEEFYKTNAKLCLVLDSVYKKLNTDKLKNKDISILVCSKLEMLSLRGKIYRLFRKKKEKSNLFIRAMIAFLRKITAVFLLKNQNIASTAIIGENVKIGKNVKIGHFTFIGDNCIIGDNTVIHENVTIKYAVIGKNCCILPGTRIGSIGFGYEVAKDSNNSVSKKIRLDHFKIVIIGDFVDIGNNVVIDRGHAKNTIISSGVKIDSIVLIGHNAYIGENTIIGGGSLIAGSVIVGKNTILAGDISISNQVIIGDNAIITSAAKLEADVFDGEIILGEYNALSVEKWYISGVINKRLMREYKKKYNKKVPKEKIIKSLKNKFLLEER